MRLTRQNILALALTLIAAADCTEHSVPPTAPAALPSSSTPRLGPKGDSAFAGLRDDTVFASNFVGIAARPSGEGRQFRVLLAQPEASRIFRQLWREAEPGGRLYALLGLKLTDPASFQQLAPILVEDKTLILSRSGCVGRWVTVGEIASRIVKGEMDSSYLPSDDLTLREFRFDSMDAEYAQRQH